MKYFTIDTICESIRHLENYSGNWLIPAFVFAANDVGEEAHVSLNSRHGTDVFLDRFFHGSLIGLPAAPNGKNLMRPRLSDVKPWQPDGEFEGDYVVRQGTKAWANVYSSRGYRDMRMRNEIKVPSPSTVQLGTSFRHAFEHAIPGSFCFEHFMVWLFAFTGCDRSVASWDDLLRELGSLLELPNGFRSAYTGRFCVSGKVPWPDTLDSRPSDVEFAIALAPRLISSLLYRGKR